MQEFFETHFLVYLICMWVSVLILLSFFGGWYQLSARYGFNGRIEGECFRFASMKIGPKLLGVNYSGILFLTVGPEGIRFSVFLPFGIMHRPFLLPWDSIIYHEFKKGFLGKSLEIHLADPPKRIVLLGKPGEACLDYLRIVEEVRKRKNTAEDTP